MTQPLTIALDGPAASGKGTLARRIAAHYGFRHLDTGLTYRAAAKALLDAGLPLDDEESAARMAREVDLAGLDRSVLSSHEIGEAASRIAVMPAVRRALVEAQRRFAATPPGAVLDGRDIGTVVCPDATVKLLRHGLAQDPCPAPLRRDPGLGQEASATRKFSPISSAATPATPVERTRPSGPPKTRTCLIRPKWV